MIPDATLWTVIVGLGLGSVFLRFGFMGFVGDREMPPWLLRHLRYTAVAIIPALVAPIVVYSGEDGWPDPARLCAAIITVAVGLISKSFITAIISGAVTLYALLFLIG